MYEQFPIYLLQLFVFFLSIKIPMKGDNWYSHVPYILDYVNIVFASYTIFLIKSNLQHNGLSVFSRPWVYFDMIYTVLLYIISFNRIIENISD